MEAIETMDLLPFTAEWMTFWSSQGLPACWEHGREPLEEPKAFFVLESFCSVVFRGSKSPAISGTGDNMKSEAYSSLMYFPSQ